MMSPGEKFMLFVTGYVTALLTHNFQDVLSDARKLSVALDFFNEEEKAWEFVQWRVGNREKPVWVRSPPALSPVEAERKNDRSPRRWRRGEEHGCYFPSTDLNVGQMGGRGTGAPKDVEWLDPVDDLPWVTK